MSIKTEPLTISKEGQGFILEKLGADCAPLQQFREITVNALEAIAAGPDATGTIVWDVDWALLAATGKWKLCCIDTGVGMSGAEMTRYINQLAASGKEQSSAANFGVGAKVAAGVQNPEGVVYLSWKDGEAAQVAFIKDRSTGAYGLQMFEIAEGRYEHVRAVGDDAKPAAIETAGTKVVLLGRSQDENTVVAPAASPHQYRWLTRYLNSRFFRLPEGVSLKVREFVHDDPTKWPRSPVQSAEQGSQYREVMGQESFLKKHSLDSGVVDVGDARVHWWLLRDEKKTRNQRNVYLTTGHMGVLYQDELYDLTTGKAAHHLLQSFGITFGQRRVVLYLEPKSDRIPVEPNTARSRLLAAGEPLPIDRWAEGFRAEVPDAIQAMLDAFLSETSSKSHQDSIARRLRKLRHLFSLGRYRKHPDGPFDIIPNIGVGEGDHQGKRVRSPGPGSKCAPQGDLYSHVVNQGHTPAQSAEQRTVFPTTRWVYRADGTRESGHLEDRAAEYLPKQHTIILNGDFRVFRKLQEVVLSDYRAIPNVAAMVRNSCEEWCEQAVVEAVMGILNLSSSEEWTQSERDTALSSEALSAVVCQMSPLLLRMRRELGKRLKAAA